MAAETAVVRVILIGAGGGYFAVHTPLALVVWAVLDGHWWWSIDNGKYN